MAVFKTSTKTIQDRLKGRLNMPCRTHRLSHYWFFPGSSYSSQAPSFFALKSVFIIFRVRFRLNYQNEIPLSWSISRWKQILFVFNSLNSWCAGCSHLHHLSWSFSTTKTVIWRIIKLWEKQLIEIVNNISLFMDQCIIWIWPRSVLPASSQDHS